MIREERKTRRPSFAFGGETRKKLRAFLEKMAATGPSVGPGTLISDVPIRYFQREGRHVTLIGVEAEQLQTICNDIVPATHGARPHTISARAVQGILDDAVIDVLEVESGSVTNRVDHAIKRVEERLRLPQREFTVWLQAIGVRVENDVSVGPVRFTAVGRNEPRIDKHFEEMKPIAPFVSWAVTKVTSSDSDAAVDLAVFQLQLALDAINLFAPRFGSSTSAAYQPGVRARYCALALVKESRRRRLLPVSHWLGPDPFSLQPMHRLPGYRRIAKLISMVDHRTAADERLLSALRWIGRGIASPWNDQALLCFVVAMEGLVLGPEKETELSYRFKTRVARLIARRKHERDVFKTIGKLYDDRSAVVHKGSMRIEQNRRNTARRLATATFFRLLQNRQFGRLESNEAIDAWFLARDLAAR